MWFLGGILSPWVYDPNFFLKYLYKAVAACAMSKNRKSIQMSVTQHYSSYLMCWSRFYLNPNSLLCHYSFWFGAVLCSRFAKKYFVKNILLSESCCEIVDVNKWHKIDTAMTFPVNIWNECYRTVQNYRCLWVCILLYGNLEGERAMVMV